MTERIQQGSPVSGSAHPRAKGNMVAQMTLSSQRLPGTPRREERMPEKPEKEKPPSPEIIDLMEVLKASLDAEKKKKKKKRDD